jgi:hypothetical protein
MSQKIGIRTCKKFHKIRQNNTKIQAISPCVFSINFQHSKFTRNNPKSINIIAIKLTKLFTSFWSRFSTKFKKKGNKPRQNNFPIFLDQTWHAIYQDWSKKIRKIIGIFLEFLTKFFKHAGVRFSKTVCKIARNSKQTKKTSPAQTCMDPGSSKRIRGVGLIQLQLNLNPMVENKGEVNQDLTGPVHLSI